LGNTFRTLPREELKFWAWQRQKLNKHPGSSDLPAVRSLHSAYQLDEETAFAVYS
jgi:hypothetical protein